MVERGGPNRPYRGHPPGGWRPLQPPTARGGLGAPPYACTTPRPCNSSKFIVRCGWRPRPLAQPVDPRAPTPPMPAPPCRPTKPVFLSSEPPPCYSLPFFWPPHPVLSPPMAGRVWGVHIVLPFSRTTFVGRQGAGAAPPTSPLGGSTATFTRLRPGDSCRPILLGERTRK